MHPPAAAHRVLAALAVGVAVCLPMSALGATAHDAPPVARHVNACWPTDNGKPMLDSLTFSPAVVDPSSGPVTVAVTARAHDTGGPGPATGVARVRLELLSDDADSGTTSGPESLDVHLTRAGNGRWTGTLVVPEGVNATYDAYPVVIDRTGLAAGGDLGLAPIGDVLDASGTPDTTPPRLTALTVSTTKVDTRRHAATVRIRGRLADDGSGPWLLTMFGPRGRDVTVHRRGTSDTFVARVRIPRRDGSYRWHLSFRAVDRDWNDVYLSHHWLVAHGFPATVRVVSGPEDTTGPRVGRVSGLPHSLDLRRHGRHVTLLVRASDAQGVRAVRASLLAHNGSGTQTRVVGFHRVSGTARRGLWRGRLAVGSCLPGPVGATVYVRAVDVDGNDTDIVRGAVRLLTLDRKPPVATDHHFTGHGVQVRLSEPVHGISAHHVHVLTAGGRVVPGSWMCRRADGHAVPCRRGPVSAATFTVSSSSSRRPAAVDWEPDHHLDVLDRAGNPFAFETVAGL